MDSRSRREFLRVSSVSIAAGLAGCSISSDTSDISDSDGDGVIDSEDYAPRDPEVQKRADIKGSSGEPAKSTYSPSDSDDIPSPTPSTPFPTDTPSPTPSPTPNPDSIPSTSKIQVNEAPDTRTNLKEYGAETATVNLRDYPKIPFEQPRLLVAMYEFPRNQILAYGHSDSISDVPSQGTKSVEVKITEGSVPSNRRLHYLVYATKDKPYSELEAEEVTQICESDPFVLTNTQIRRDEPDYFPGDASTDHYVRRNTEGTFDLEFSGITEGRGWNTGLFIYGSYYAQMRQKPRGRGYDEYVAVAQNTGIADTLGNIFHDSAKENGFTNKRIKVEYVIDLVQLLPYVTDDVSRGFDEYPKFPAETIVDARGDCEDTSILLASILQSTAFNYDMVLIQPPGHMACGIYGQDLPGYYWEYNGRKYYYIETTGTGWGIGDLPETYQDESAIIHQV